MAVDPTSDDIIIKTIQDNINNLGAGRKPLVLLSTGSYNPIHLQHVRMFYLARQVCVCFLAPSTFYLLFVLTHLLLLWNASAATAHDSAFRVSGGGGHPQPKP